MKSNIALEFMSHLLTHSDFVRQTEKGPEETFNDTLSEVLDDAAIDECLNEIFDTDTHVEALEITKDGYFSLPDKDPKKENFSNFFYVDPLGDLSEEELAEPVGRNYRTHRHVYQFLNGLLLFTLKKLFNPHVSLKNVKAVMDWMFVPIVGEQDKVEMFSFQHLCNQCNVEPNTYRSFVHQKMIEKGVYDRLSNNSEIVRTSRDIPMHLKADNTTKLKVLQKMERKWALGELPKIRTYKQLINLVNKQFKALEQTPYVDELFSKSNIRKTDRSNKKNEG